MKADAIIFDKDGTLIDFDAFWISISEKAIGALLKALHREDIPMEEILFALGVRDGETDVDSVLCKGTYEQMGEIVHGVLARHGCEISREDAIRMVLDLYTANMGEGAVRPTCPGLADALKALKAQGKRLAVVTTDNDVMTRRCLQELGIEDLFERIYADDGKTPMKPDPYCAEDFCRRLGISKERLLMVGDTMTDVHFARNAGISVVGVAKRAAHREFLAPHVDHLVAEIAELPALLED